MGIPPGTASITATLPEGREIDDPGELLYLLAPHSVQWPDVKNLKDADLEELAGFHEGEVEVAKEPDGQITVILPTHGRTASPKDFSIQEISGIFAAVNERRVREQMLGRFAKGALDSLQDRYARFLDPETHSWLRGYEDKEYVGIGAGISDGGLLHVVWKGTPADRAGLRSGDHVLSIDGVTTEGMSRKEAAKRIGGRNPEGSLVQLNIRRGDQTFDLTVRRERIRPSTVLARDEGGIRWVSISHFRQATFQDFVTAMTPWPAALVLDLRENSGGLISQAVKVADYLVGVPLEISISDRDGRRTASYRLDETLSYAGPLVVVVNPGTASSGEILASVIQMSHRGYLIGQPTEGKSWTQTVANTAGGALVSFTSGQWEINGRRQESLVPDVQVSDGEEEGEVVRVLTGGAS